MLNPEVANFPPPKTKCSLRQNLTLETATKTIEINSFYKSLVITCPDELRTPVDIEEMITEDSDFYKISNVSLTELVEQSFIENFVKTGSIYCLSAERNCVVENCVAITPDGMLTLHVLEFIYQSLGLEGKKRPHNFTEVTIDLKTLKKHEKVKQALSKLELFDLYMLWEPYDENICPSSLAKYFDDRKVAVTVHSLLLRNITPDVKEVPSLKDVEVDELVEWTGMLALEADLNEPETYISTYSQPESELAIKTRRISVLIVKGFIPPSLIVNVCNKLTEYSNTRNLDNYWTSISIQSHEDSLWQWEKSSPKMFQSHYSSLTVFFTTDGLTTYSVGQIKYS